jgi:hypothetical protein
MYIPEVATIGAGSLRRAHPTRPLTALGLVPSRFRSRSLFDRLPVRSSWCASGSRTQFNDHSGSAERRGSARSNCSTRS